MRVESIEVVYESPNMNLHSKLPDGLTKTLTFVFHTTVYVVACCVVGLAGSYLFKRGIDVPEWTFFAVFIVLTLIYPPFISARAVTNIWLRVLLWLIIAGGGFYFWLLSALASACANGLGCV